MRSKRGDLTYLVATNVASLLIARCALRNWGATKTERATVWPGDELVNGPARSVTRAVTIQAPAEQVWRWLVQIGENRAGVYGYEKLEDLLGIDVPHTDCIKPLWQRLTEGDEVDLPGRNWFGSPDIETHTVATVVPGQVLVLVSG
ncbi:MAG: SRPBCC family protein, partial [Jatrophihabitantaceae bacterium]